MSDVFDKDYYLNGIETGKSNYVNYSWKPELTIRMAHSIIHYLGIKSNDTVFDFGCSRGYLVKALRILGVQTWGYDISKWAIDNCDPEVKDYVHSTMLVSPKFDWIVCKDCAEHVDLKGLKNIISAFNEWTKKGMLIIVPLTDKKEGKYLRNEDEMDKTHVIRWTLPDWLLFLEDNAPDFMVSGSYHVDGVKQASEKVRKSCGFFTLKRKK